MKILELFPNKHPGQHHTMHTHPNSLISGVFYFGESEEGIPAIKFHNTVLGVNSFLSAKKIKEIRSMLGIILL